MAPAVKRNWYLWFRNFFVYKNQKRSYILRYNHVLLMSFDNANRHYSYRIIEKFFVGQATRLFLQVQNRWQEQGIKSTRNRMISKRGKWVTTSCNNHHQLGPPRPVFWVIRCLRQSPQSNQMLARILQHKIQGIKKFLMPPPTPQPAKNARTIDKFCALA